MAPPEETASVFGQGSFFYDFASAEAYLLAEQVNSALPEVPEWIPVRIGGPAFRCAEEEGIHRARIERRAHELALQPVRWPDPYPADSELALLAATYAKQIGRAVAFSLAAFRQAFAAGRDLGERDWVLIAAAACEMHPAAVLRGIESAAVRRRLDEATAAARAAGVRDLPAVLIGDRVLHGEQALEAAPL